MVSFITPTGIPDLSGKVIFITGGNTGLGKEAALQLAKHNPANIFLGSRSEERGLAAIADIVATVPRARLTLIPMDLASLDSVLAAAEKFLEHSSRLDILMNNAGIMAVPPQLTVDGYEIQFGTNHLGHALLTKVLLPTMLKTAQILGSDVRIITLSSNSHHRAPEAGIQFQNLRSANDPTSALTRYGQSKLANILYSKELAQRYPDIKAIAVHPGTVNTSLTATMRESFLLAQILTPIVTFFTAVGIEEGALNQLWAATSADVESGEFYEPVGRKSLGSKMSRDMTLARSLWQWTENELANWK
ncbi:NAD(P)-binding protein-22 [Coleophoma crateriformis]|uniref:NAD(P)-binding protein-22 n=1 Tax=Coleophoma crateriformis TaxID=565419 RepID=A0A3D8T3S5_9HELO|nr:NAD(P)-binding protein-22 [Coleophoma crateriformis]